jgi:hypothetical protein
MSNKYPLDITLTCSVALEGGLAKYRDILKPLPAGSMYLIKDWNRALIDTMKQPQFKKHLGAVARAIVLLKSPKATAAIIDKIAVPYRSFYYAKRFTEAYNFVAGAQATGVCDFGRGLSPLIHVIKTNYPDMKIYSKDTDERANEIYDITSAKLGLPNHTSIPCLKTMELSERTAFVSLGTFSYIPKEDQARKLNLIRWKFHKSFIELRLGDNTSDSQLVEKFGTRYNPGFTRKEMEGIFGAHIQARTLSDYMAAEGEKLYTREFKCLAKAILESSECFVQI